MEFVSNGNPAPVRTHSVTLSISDANLRLIKRIMYHKRPRCECTVAVHTEWWPVCVGQRGAT